MKKIAKPTFYTDTNDSDFVNKCEDICNQHKNCFGFNKNKTSCILWTEQIREKVLNNDMNMGGCYKKDTHGGENEHALTIDEVPEHGHMLFSNNPIAFGKGNSKGFMADVSHGGGIIKNDIDFETKLSLLKK